jgi:signal transduction histidine kinase/CheY-like chemotaxis protein
MRWLLSVWTALSETGLRHATDPAAQKLLRLQNRISVLSILVVSIQSVTFYRLQLHYILLINFGTLLGYFTCLGLSAVGKVHWARYLFIVVAAIGIGHHHIYFGFSSGFWLLLLNLTQAAFILFPQEKMAKIAAISAVITLSVLFLILFTYEERGYYAASTPELASMFMRGNLIRSPLLLVLVAYYLVFENRRVESELRYSARQADSAVEAKALFLSNISHELRTPMNAIQGFSDILLEAADSIDSIRLREKFQLQLKQIRLSATNLTSIINDLLDFARIDKNQIVFAKKSFSLGEVAHHVMQTAEFYGFKHRKIDTEVLLEEGLPERVVGDPVRLSQILLNLAANAMKFTHEGFVRLRIQMLHSSPSAITIGFEIEDSGIGIARDRLPYLFESFSTSAATTEPAHGGTGLGLAITKRLVEMQGGTITVMSKEGAGSLFTVQLPFERAENLPEKKAKPTRDLRKKKILVAEDNEANQMLVRSLLESWNAELVIVDDGTKAVDKIKSKPFDLVLMDLQMRKMDGIQATEKIRALPDAARAAIPIIAFSADVLSDTRKKVMTAGMNDIVTKPINQAELYAALRNALKILE